MRLSVNLIPAVLIFAAIALFSSCSGNSEKSEAGANVLTEVQKEQVKADVSEFVYPMPTAFELTEMLNKIEASYILSLSNPFEKAEKYFSEKSRALNLGIYGADLSYASTYNQKQTVIDYMNASNTLIKELNFAEVIDKNLISNIESVENNKDSLIDLISQTFIDTYKYLNAQNRGPISSLILAGTWVEGLYIATHISENTFNNPKMLKIIMSQKEPLNKLMTLITKNSSNVDVAAVGVSLQQLHVLFGTLDEGSITEQQIIAITKEVANVRNKIVE